MHPLEKLVLLLSACQALQFTYLLWHVHYLHASDRTWYLIKLAPLAICLALLFGLWLRIFGAPIPFFI